MVMSMVGDKGWREHRWCYRGAMVPGEMWIFKQFDSERKGGKGGGVRIRVFELEARDSLEVRALVGY